MKIKLDCMECGCKFTVDNPDEVHNLLEPECPNCGSTDYEVDDYPTPERAQLIDGEAMKRLNAPLTNAIRTILAITEDQRSPKEMITAIRRVVEKTLKEGA